MWLFSVYGIFLHSSNGSLYNISSISILFSLNTLYSLKLAYYQRDLNENAHIWKWYLWISLYLWILWNKMITKHQNMIRYHRIIIVFITDLLSLIFKVIFLLSFLACFPVSIFTCLYFLTLKLFYFLRLTKKVGFKW